MFLVYIGLGSNLGDRAATIQAALGRLAADADIELVAVSSLRETDPVGFEEQPRFLNAAAAIRTVLEPRELLDRMLKVERGLGRVREGARYGPRTIDLDLLLYGDAVVDQPGLAIPHPRLQERVFVLEPLMELDPHLEVPGQGRVQALLAGLQ
jgi:2-amino-4-hydroxy-6-hydroxymethyldihydropteridine diphosphokinase